MGESVVPQPSPAPPGAPVPAPYEVIGGDGGRDLRWSLENVLSGFGQLWKGPGPPALTVHAIPGLFIALSGGGGVD